MISYQIIRPILSVISQTYINNDIDGLNWQVLSCFLAVNLLWTWRCEQRKLAGCTEEKHKVNISFWDNSISYDGIVFPSNAISDRCFNGTRVLFRIKEDLLLMDLCRWLILTGNLIPENWYTINQNVYLPTWTNSVAVFPSHRGVNSYFSFKAYRKLWKLL
jgi:hypothetical protein